MLTRHAPLLQLLGRTRSVCALLLVADPHCTVVPNTVPKAMDVITPPGVNQSTELDYTLGPVVIQGVIIP